jgi:hypothetical protein
LATEKFSCVYCSIAKSYWTISLSLIIIHHFTSNTRYSSRWSHI